MAEVLSQSQIDALINAAKTGGGETLNQQKEEKKYSKYDFRSPRKYTKERLKMLNGVFENYSRVLNTRINGLLHATCEVEVDTVDEQRYYEFANALVDGEVVTVCNLILNNEEEEIPVILVITPTIMVSMMDRMMGGNGDVEGDLPSDYTYTDLDLCIYQNLMQEYISILGGSWENYIHLDFKFGRVETNPTLVQLIPMDETVVMVSIDVSFPNATGRIDICLPDAVLSKIFSEIARGTVIQKRQQEDHSDEIYARLRESELEITAELGRTFLQLRDIYELNVGDVIDMNLKQDSSVQLRIGGHVWFDGLMGTHQKYLAVKIQDISAAVQNIQQEISGKAAEKAAGAGGGGAGTDTINETEGGSKAEDER